MNNLLASLVLSSIAIVPGTGVANPTSTSVFIACPDTKPDGANTISNFGNYIAGFGSETIFSVSIPIYFKSNQYPYNTPSSLLNYSNSAMSYDSTTGIITCSYQGTTNDPLIEVSYTLTNGKGGIIESPTNNSLSLIIPIGLKG